MEEVAGKLWDRFMTRMADTRHAEAAVTLPEISRTAGILFRALGGDSGLDMKAAQAAEHGARRSWLQRLAGKGMQTELAWCDDEALNLPSEIALFSQRALNRSLYFWLIALTAEMQSGDWFVGNQRATLRVFERYPGFASNHAIDSWSKPACVLTLLRCQRTKPRANAPCALHCLSRGVLPRCRRHANPGSRCICGCIRIRPSRTCLPRTNPATLLTRKAPGVTASRTTPAAAKPSASRCRTVKTASCCFSVRKAFWDGWTIFASTTPPKTTRTAIPLGPQMTSIA